jgi:thiosulfate/3-mercaptopyruvate sulfurtransferase
MSTTLRSLALILTVLAVPALLPAAEPPPLVTHDALQKRLDDPSLRLLDTRSEAEYAKGHIPGAVWVDTKILRGMTATPEAFQDRATWESWIKPLGIGPETEVLIIDGDRQLNSARLWGLLRYLGVRKVGLIDGNFALWEKEGRPVTADVPKVDPKPFAVDFQNGRFATRDRVLSAIKEGNARVVDARSIEEFTGEKKMSKRGGHIPDACHLEWSELVDADGRFLDAKTLKAKLTALGIKPGEAVITHCQGGGRASVDAFAIERLGFPTSNYYEGWSDWGNAEDTPITEGQKPSKAP